MDAGWLTIKVKVRGRVQHVGYRRFVQDVATEMGLFGKVRNGEDGTVEVLARLPSISYNAFVLLLKEGSPGSRVRDVEVTETQDVVEGRQFLIVD